MRITLIISFLFLNAVSGISQLRVFSGTTITIEPGTELNIDISGQNFVIDSSAFVINNGLITLGDSTDINEFPMFPITGTGTETTTRNLAASLAGINVGGFGTILNDDSIPGITTITRGHKVLYTAGTEQSVKRWFSIYTTGLFPSGFSMTFHYDPTELNGNNVSSVKVIRTNDTSLAWGALGGISNDTLFSTTALIDSTGFFTLFSTEIKFISLNDTVFCLGDSLKVNYEGNGLFNASNTFILQLSDSSGSFLMPTIQDTLSSDMVDFNELLSPVLLPGANYKIRILSTSPDISTNDTAITILGLPVISMSGLLAQYCSNESPSFIGISPPGGTYNVSFLVADSIYPASGTIGTNYFNYFFTDANGCSAQYNDSTQIILAPPVPLITLSFDTLFSSAILGNQWYFNGSPLTGEINNFIIPTSNGIYEVETSNGICSEMSAAFNYTTLGQVLFSNQANFKLFPNPAFGNSITLQYQSENRPLKITVLSSLGEIINTINTFGDSGVILKSDDFASGSYIVIVYMSHIIYSLPLIIIK